MYQCENCKIIFEEPTVFIETHGFNDGWYESYSGCPDCGEDFAEMFQCKECGEWFSDDESLYSGYCYECIKHSPELIDADNCIICGKLIEDGDIYEQLIEGIICCDCEQADNKQIIRSVAV